MAVITDITNGSTISFQSKAVNDNNFYIGKVIGQVTSEIALSYDDVSTYNTSVQSADPNVPAIELQSFFLIKLLETITNAEKYIIPFSSDWINLPTLKIITSDRIALISVYEVDSTNAQDVINLLMAAGFKAKVTALT